MPVRNAAPWVEAALRSVIDQSLPPGEILVADDGSEDGTPALVESLGLPGVRILRTEKRLGISRQLNRMLELAGGRYLARMDGDDLAHPERFRKQMERMESGSFGIVGTWSRRFGVDRTVHRFATEDRDLKAGLLFSVPFCHPSVLIDRERVGAFLYDPAFDTAEDYHLWAALRGRTTYGNVPEVLLDWRMHDRNVGTVQASASTQRSLARAVRDGLLRDYGVSMPSPERLALEARMRSETLDLQGARAFLRALLALRVVPEDLLLSDRAAQVAAMAEQWHLSCLFSVWSVPGILRLWWEGCRALGVAPSPRTGLKLALKRTLGTLRLGS